MKEFVNMKILKNHGDYYIPKSDYKSSKETRILHILLVIIVLFTAVFLIVLSRHYSSAAEFFGKGEVTVTEQENKEVVLPDIDGKTNFLVFETDDEQSKIHYIFLIQADKTNKAYKVCSLSPKTKIDKKSLYDIYSEGGGASLQTKLTEYLGVQIDYYAAFDSTSFIDFTSKLGSFVMPINKEIKFSGGSDEDKYTLHVSEGEQNIDSRTFSYLLRYYSEEKADYSNENEALLYAFTNLFNSENLEDCDSLFRLFIKSASTNITVRNFENNKDTLTVFCTINNDITVYSAEVKYEDNVLTQKSVKEIKGYFNK